MQKRLRTLRERCLKHLLKKKRRFKRLSNDFFTHFSCILTVTWNFNKTKSEEQEKLLRHIKTLQCIRKSVIHFTGDVSNTDLTVQTMLAPHTHTISQPANQPASVILASFCWGKIEFFFFSYSNSRSNIEIEKKIKWNALENNPRICLPAGHNDSDTDTKSASASVSSSFSFFIT